MITQTCGFQDFYTHSNTVHCSSVTPHCCRPTCSLEVFRGLAPGVCLYYPVISGILCTNPICLSILSFVWPVAFKIYIIHCQWSELKHNWTFKKVNIAFDIAIVGVILIVKWKHLILSTVNRLEKLISIYRREPDCASIVRQSYPALSWAYSLNCRFSRTNLWSVSHYPVLPDICVQTTYICLF